MATYEDPEKNEKQLIEERASPSDEESIRHIDTVGENVNARLANPLEGIPHEKLMAHAARFAREHGLGHLEKEFQKGALIAQDPEAFESLSQLDEADKAILRREVTHRWHQPFQLYYMVILCSLAAAVQGVSNSANFFRSLHARANLICHRWMNP